MTKHSYEWMEADPCVYVKQFHDGNFIILLLYVDDMLITGQDIAMIRRLKEELSKSFDMKNFGPTKQILGMEIFHNRKTRKLWFHKRSTLNECWIDSSLSVPSQWAHLLWTISR